MAGVGLLYYYCCCCYYYYYYYYYYYCYSYCYYYYYLFIFCPEVLHSPRDLDIINLVGVLSGWSGLVVHRRGEGTGEGHKIVSLDWDWHSQSTNNSLVTSDDDIIITRCSKGEIRLCYLC